MKDMVLARGRTAILEAACTLECLPAAFTATCETLHDICSWIHNGALSF